MCQNFPQQIKNLEISLHVYDFPEIQRISKTFSENLRIPKNFPEISYCVRACLIVCSCMPCRGTGAIPAQVPRDLDPAPSPLPQGAGGQFEPPHAQPCRGSSLNSRGLQSCPALTSPGFNTHADCVPVQHLVQQGSIPMSIAVLSSTWLQEGNHCNLVQHCATRESNIHVD